MAFDISTEGRTPRSAPPPTTFDEFIDIHSDALARALQLACGDSAVADSALHAALVKTAQQWKRLGNHDNVLGWAFNAGVSSADDTLNKRAPLALNRATGGYTRGLPLDQAIAALPLQQRAALVMSNYWGWSDDHASLGIGEPVDTVATRRTRAVSFVGHHLRVESGDAAQSIRALFESHAAGIEPKPVVAAAIRRAARRRTVRTRVGAVVAGAVLIAGGAGLVQVTSAALTPTPDGPQPIAGPSTSVDWFAPVSDGQGGFVALNVAGSSEFAETQDGVTWFEASTWNSRAVDLRTEVSGFTRSGGRYIATIEAARSIRSAVPPRIATSTDLRDWSVSTIDIVMPDDVEGLRSRARISRVQAAGGKIMAAVEIEEVVDYNALGIGRQDICVDVDFDALRAFYLCEGEIVTLSRTTDQVAASTVFVLSEDGGPFETVSLPAGVDPQSLESFGGRFVVVDPVRARLLISRDGRTWTELDNIKANRFALVSGRDDGRVLVVHPNQSGWASSVLDADLQVAGVELDVDLDPASVWTKPQLSSGPAGWALLVTTSRPWERVDTTPGWAVDTGDWVVSRMPGSGIITAQDELRLTTYRFNEDSDSLQIAPDGSVTLSFPEVEEDERVLVEVTGDQIERSRSNGGVDEIKSQVLFSADGVSWRTIWQSNEDTWFASVAVAWTRTTRARSGCVKARTSIPARAQHLVVCTEA